MNFVYEGGALLLLCKDASEVVNWHHLDMCLPPSQQKAYLKLKADSVWDL